MAEPVNIKESGFAIKGESGGYFEINGIGDWSLAGDECSAAIFRTKTAAAEAIEQHELDNVSVVAITRTTAVTVGEQEAGS
jgi:hypothetical protein